MKYDVVVIGAGISGLTCASLLARTDLKVCIIDSQYKVGGSSGIFKRSDTIFDQGAAMIYGFGERGYNSHRFVFNCLEEHIDVIKHEHLYAINYGEHRIIFYYDLDKFTDQLGEIFPSEKNNIKRFYKDMKELYLNVIANNPTYVTPDVILPKDGLKQLLRNPLSYIKFLSYLNISTEKLLKRYFKDPEIFNFFDKLTSTYCYTTVKESPAVLGAIMFIDNHLGGSYYPLNSTLHLVGKMEKVIEENGGDVLLNHKVKSFNYDKNILNGVILDDDTIINSDKVVYSGNVWSLYQELLNKPDKVKNLIPTYPSLVLYSLVNESVIPKDTLPIEMLIDDKTKINEGELTAYILSIDDPSICPKGYHTVITIGPSFKEWPIYDGNNYHDSRYEEMKKIEIERILDVLESRFNGFKDNIVHLELSTPTTLQKYCNKYKGAVAGPKQQLGQHMLRRLKIRGEIPNLYCCGESTILGTGTPAVTVSGIAAANLILRDLGMKEYVYYKDMSNFVNIASNSTDVFRHIKDNNIKDIVLKANKCQYCEVPLCEQECPIKLRIRDINIKLSTENIVGARKITKDFDINACINCKNRQCESLCIRNQFDTSVEIHNIIKNLDNIKL